jgi:hypothetical protein
VSFSDFSLTLPKRLSQYDANHAEEPARSVEEVESVTFVEDSVKNNERADLIALSLCAVDAAASRASVGCVSIR